MRNHKNNPSVLYSNHLQHSKRQELSFSTYFAMNVCRKQVVNYHHRSIMLSVLRQLTAFFPPVSFLLGKTFQNLRVSSPAPVTMVLPSGLMARYRTRQVWPVRVAIFSMRGYFQMLISLWEQPWVLTSSFSVLLNIRLHTCEPTSSVFTVLPVSVFRKRMVRSAVPPPETSNPCWCGDHATAFTAARWSQYLRIGSAEWLFQTRSLLSLPPEHSCCSSGDHFSPHTSCLWPVSRFTNGALSRRSRWRMVLSLEPVLRREELQAMAPTRLECPVSVLTFFILAISQICTSPLLVPSEKCGPLRDQPTAVVESETPRSQSLLTLELAAFQRQTLEERPTARKFCEDQSIRFRQQSSCSAGASSTLMGTLLILRFLVAFSASSGKSQMAFFWRGWKGEWLVLLLKRRMLLFSQVSMGACSRRGGDSSITHRRQRSISLLPSPSPGLFSSSSSISDSSYRSIDSIFSNFRAGMQRSVTADCASESVGECWRVGEAAQKAGRRSG